jgi:hypothetical protein
MLSLGVRRSSEQTRLHPLTDECRLPNDRWRHRAREDRGAEGATISEVSLTRALTSHSGHSPFVIAVLNVSPIRCAIA